MCCSPWGHKESDMTEQLNKNKDKRSCLMRPCFLVRHSLSEYQFQSPEWKEKQVGFSLVWPLPMGCPAPSNDMQRFLTSDLLGSGPNFLLFISLKLNKLYYQSFTLHICKMKNVGTSLLYVIPRDVISIPP